MNAPGVSIVLALLLAPLGAHAEDPAPPPASTLEDEFKLIAEPTVTAASKHVQLLSEAPSSVTVITAEQIERFGYLTLGDLLQSVRSFYISNDRNYSYVGVRGFARPGDYNSRVLFLLDGHSVNENIYDSTAMLGPDAGIDLSTVDRVEIVRGPGSSLYGTSAFFAVINVITKKGSQIEGYRPVLIGGNRGRYGTSLNYGKGSPGGIDFRLSGSFLDTHGEDLYFSQFDDPSTNFGRAEDTDGEESRQGSFQVAYGDWTFVGYHSSRTKRVPTASFDTEFNNSSYFTRDTSALLDARFDHRIGTDLELNVRGYYDWYAYQGVYPYAGTPEIMNDDSASVQWGGEEVSLAWQIRPSNRLTFGENFESTIGARQRNFDRRPYFEYVDINHSFSQWAVFVQDEWRMSDHFILSVGSRLDQYDSFGGTVSPRLALVVQATPDTTLKFLAGSAFRAPNVYERFYADGVSLEPAGSLDPERVNSYEMIYERRVSNFGTFTASAFRNDVRNLITPVSQPSGLARFMNIDSARTAGLEVGGRVALGSALLAYGSGSYISGKDGDGDRLTNSPRQMFKLGVSVPFRGKSLFASTEYHYLGERRTLAGDSTPASTDVDITLLYRLKQSPMSISATVANLFDHDNYAPGSFEHVQDQIIQPGRWFFLKIVTTF